MFLLYQVRKGITKMEEQDKSINEHEGYYLEVNGELIFIPMREG